MAAPRKLRVGLALGSSSARGWAHIGVIRALEEAGIRPDVVCGTSISPRAFFSLQHWKSGIARLGKLSFQGRQVLRQLLVGDH